MTARDIRPFLPIVATPTRPLGAALPALATTPVTSPWSPRVVIIDQLVPPSPAELAALHDEARDRGRADGVAETAALRAQLTELLAALAQARAAIAAPAAELIAEITSCVIEAWTEHTDTAAMFAPLIRAWAEQAPAQPATARVHPGDVAALTTAVGDAPLTIIADPALPPGALEIRNPTLELCHDWRTRLAELRTAIAGALTGAESSDGSDGAQGVEG